MRGRGGGALWSRIFGLALWAHPPAWRERFGREALDAFEAGLARRRNGSGAAAARRYATRAILDALAAGWRERGLARGARGGAADSIRVDLRNAARRLLRAPGLSATVVAILALGVGANAAVFSVLRSAVLAPLPFPEADRLVLPRWTTTSPPAPDTVFGQWSYPKFVEFREGSRDVFDVLAGYASRSAALTDPGDAESVLFEFVTPGYFEILGVDPVLGRFFTPGEEGGDAPPGVVVISHGFWVERFGSDPDALGRTVTADGGRLEIVGVAPEGFRGLTGSARLWIPVGQARQAYGSWATDARGSHWFHALGRLATGVGPAAAEARLASLADEIEAVDPAHAQGEDVGIDLAPLASVWSNGDARASVWLAMVAAGLILAIAVANVAALLLARGRRERRETAVRLALGAARGRLLRERLAEGTLLASAGGAAGVLAAAWVIRWLRGIIPEHLFRGAAGDVLLVASSGFGVDGGLLLAALGAALLVGAVLGIVPVLAQNDLDLVPALRGTSGGSRTLGGGGGRWLVGGQVALSIVLLVGAGLLIGTLYRLHGEQRGFDPERLLVLRYSLGGPESAYDSPEAAMAFHREFRDRVRSLPAVRSASLGTTPPLSGHYMLTHVSEVVGRPPYAEGQRPRIGVHFLEGGYFATVGTGLLRGRTFTPADAETRPPPVVISQEAAERLFPGEAALGRGFRLGFRSGDVDYAFQVVGVVEDVLYSAPVDGIMPEAYLPLGFWTPAAMSLLVRTVGDPSAVVPEARRVLADLDPDIPFWRVTTGRELRGQDVADTRILVVLLGAFAGLAVLLSTAGLWAVVARAVAERRREIGLRMALGARAREVEGLVFRQGLAPIAAGGLVGLGLAGLLAPRLEAVLFGVGPRSPGVFVAAAATLVGVALLATWLPARRAARVDPMEALGSE